jgi:hypothetical protein
LEAKRVVFLSNENLISKRKGPLCPPHRSGRFRVVFWPTNNCARRHSNLIIFTSSRYSTDTCKIKLYEIANTIVMRYLRKAHKVSHSPVDHTALSYPSPEEKLVRNCFSKDNCYSTDMRISICLAGSQIAEGREKYYQSQELLHGFTLALGLGRHV